MKKPLSRKKVLKLYLLDFQMGRLMGLQKTERKAAAV